ncbi:MAG: cation:proton antiporter [Burkholderiales bacterium]
MLTTWFLLSGALLLLMMLSGTLLERLPISAAIIYLLIGVSLGPYGAGLLRLDPMASSKTLELVAEVAVLISLFTVGLKLKVSVFDRAWRLPLRLAGWTMIVTIALIAAVAMLTLDLTLGTALLLGAILAPTDPVLASDVQVRNVGDKDRVRFGLTGEGGLNDGIAFPFVMLGLGLMGLHEIGDNGSLWLWRDVAWPIAAGIASGWLCGILVGYWVLYLRRVHREALGSEEFLALGLIAFSYGLALLIDSYGFLAVFAAGLGLRRIGSSRLTAATAKVSKPVVANIRDQGAPETPAQMANALIDFNQQLERIVEVAVVVLLGSMISMQSFTPQVLWFCLLLFLFIRPVAVTIGLIGSRTPNGQARLLAWFGIRGLGSLYYLMYSINHGLSDDVAQGFVNVVFGVIAMSIVVHGISATPLMDRYYARRGLK